MRVEHELLRRALVEVLIALRRLVEPDHGRVDRLRDRRLVVEDHLHQPVVGLHHRALPVTKLCDRAQARPTRGRNRLGEAVVLVGQPEADARQGGAEGEDDEEEQAHAPRTRCTAPYSRLRRLRGDDGAHLRRVRDPVRGLRKAAAELPDLRRPTTVRPSHRTGVDDAGRARRRPRERDPRRRRADRDRHRAALRHRPAGAARPPRRPPPSVGLREPARRSHGGRRRRARRARRDRDLAPSLLLLHGRLGAPVRLPGPPARGRRGVDHGPGPGDRALGRRDARPRRGRDADPRRRALPRRDDPASGRPAVDRGHHPGRPRPHPRGVHVELPQPGAAARRRGPAAGRRGGPVRVRRAVRRVVGNGHPGGRRGGRAAVRGALHPGAARRPVTPHRASSRLLVALCALLLAGAATAGYADRVLFDGDRFAARTTTALQDPDVRTVIADRVTDQLVLRNRPDLLTARPLISGAVSGLVGGQTFATILRAATRDAHRAVFDRDQDTLTLTLADAGAVVAAALRTFRPELADELEDERVVLVRERLGTVTGDLARFGERARLLGWLLLALAGAAAAGAVVLARDKRRSAAQLGLAILAAGLLVVLATAFAKAIALAPVGGGEDRAAARAIWDAYLGDLTKLGLLLAACGAVVAAAASSLIPAVELDLRAGWTRVTARAPARWLAVARGVVLVALGGMAIADPLGLLRLAITLAGLAAVYSGLVSLLRLIHKPPAQAAAATGTPSCATGSSTRSPWWPPTTRCRSRCQAGSPRCRSARSPASWRTGCAGCCSTPTTATCSPTGACGPTSAARRGSSARS